MWQYARANVVMFGPREGLLASIGQVFPVFDTLRCWRHRAYRSATPKAARVVGDPDS